MKEEFDPKIVAEAKKEMEIESAKEELEFGRKSGYAVYKPEGNKQEKYFDDNLEVELDNVDVSDDKLVEEIFGLRVAKKSLELFLTSSDVATDELRKMTLSDLQKMGEKIPEAIKKDLDTLVKFEIDGSVILKDLPEEIEEKIGNDKLIRDHLHKKKF